MKICILGWYGTETLGDRSILDGIFYILNRAFTKFTVSIGSINPSFTHRSLIEDGIIYARTAPQMKLEKFDAKSIQELENEIKTSDLVIMGGGPIMDDIQELLVINKGFKIARKHNVKTMIFGCGLGPLNKKRYINITNDILDNSAIIVFRDQTSCLTAKSLFGDKYKYYYSHDPAILSIVNYLEANKNIKRHNRVVLNLRKFPEGTYGKRSKISNEILEKMIEKLSLDFENVLLVPMHTFFVGGDDRKYLTEVSYNISRSNVKVLHETMSIHELYKVFHESHACIGMRYHSVVLQTLLNGNNFILDYTSKKSGKISSFLQMIDKNDFYNDRYINIQETIGSDIIQKLQLLEGDDFFKYDENIFTETCDFYVSKLLKELR